MSHSARPRVAFVTGANRGIGLEICRQLATKGITVALGARDGVKGEAAAGQLKREGLAVLPIVCDVTSGASVTEAVANIEAQLGPLDVLVNNAAVLLDRPGGFAASMFDLEESILRLTFATNLEGPVRLMKAVLPGMRARRYGRVVNVSSLAGQLAGMGAGFPAYRISKAALNAATRIMADEVREPNVKINAMSPGWVRTDMGGPDAERSVEEGADTAVWLAMLPQDGPNGGFYEDRTSVAW